MGGPARHIQKAIPLPQDPPEPPAESAPKYVPTPEELDVTGLGSIVAAMRGMTVTERMRVAEYIAVVWPTAPEPPPQEVTLDELTQTLGHDIAQAYLRGVRLSSYTLARLLVESGWRKVGQ